MYPIASNKITALCQNHKVFVLFIQKIRMDFLKHILNLICYFENVSLTKCILIHDLFICKMCTFVIGLFYTRLFWKEICQGCFTIQQRIKA